MVVGFSPTEGACAAIRRASSFRISMAALFLPFLLLSFLFLSGRLSACFATLPSLLFQGTAETLRCAQNLISKQDQAKNRQDRESAFYELPFNIQIETAPAH